MKKTVGLEGDSSACRSHASISNSLQICSDYFMTVSRRGGQMMSSGRTRAEGFMKSADPLSRGRAGVFVSASELSIKCLMSLIS